MELNSYISTNCTTGTQWTVITLLRKLSFIVNMREFHDYFRYQHYALAPLYKKIHPFYILKIFKG